MRKAIQNIPFLLLLAIASSWLLSGCAAARQMPILEFMEMHKDSPLAPYIHCKCDSALEIVDISGYREDMPKFREIRKDDGAMDTVSVMEGYRVMYAYAGADYYFANVKVEASDPAQYPSDKEKLISMLRGYSSDTTIRMRFRDEGAVNGLEVYGSEKPRIDAGGVIGTYLIFSDSDHVVVSVYLLNQGKDHRRFNDMEQYGKLRDNFLEKFTACMRKRDPKTPLSL